MPTGPPRSLYDLPTPALLLDLDVLDGNLRRMARRCEALGVALRPHVKTHKCVEVGERQRALGARGITVSTLEEARVFARHGFDDLTWAFPVPPVRAREAVELASEVRLGVTVDSLEAVEALVEALHANGAKGTRETPPPDAAGRPEAAPVGAGAEAAPGHGGAALRAWLKVDCGYGRAGVDPESEAALRVARAIADSPSLGLAGILSHSGHAYGGRSPEGIESVAEEERAVMAAFAERLRAAGFEVPEVSVGSTPSMAHARHLEGITEARPGNYALYDHTQVLLGSCETVDCAATVLASVISGRPGSSRSVVDAGALALSKDTGPDWGPGGYGPLLESPESQALHPSARVVSVSQEHGIVNASFPVGTRVRIVPQHSCLTVACFDRMHAVRGEAVVGEWKVWRARS